MDWQIFDPYNGSHPNGPYASSARPPPPMPHAPSSYPQYNGQQQPTTPGPARQIHAHHQNLQYQYEAPQYSSSPKTPMVVLPQHSPEYLAQFQQYPTYDEPATQRYSQPQPQNRAHPDSKFQPQPPMARRLPVTTPNPDRKPLVKAEPAPSAQQSPFPIDFHVLLTLADEYITAARSIASRAALGGTDDDVEQYGKLMATGMASIECVLKRCRLQPRMEAVLRLRYAALIYEDTTNYRDAETVLSKGILLCDTNRLFNLKYSMRHLSARVMFKSNPKAALKSLDKIIPDAETMRHEAWVYALRFLRVSLSMQTGIHHDALSALQHLRSISAQAESNRYIGIFVTCAAFEAMAHLLISAPDSIEQAQRAIASARSYQLEAPPSSLPQAWTMLDIFDVVCSLEQCQSPDQVLTKMEAIQKFLDQQLADNHSLPWRDDGTFLVTLGKADSELTENSNGIFQKTRRGQVAMTFSWLPPRDLHLLVYYLSGLIKMQAPSSGENKKDKALERASRDLELASKQVEEYLQMPSIKSTPLPTAIKRKEWHQLARSHILLSLVFLSCQRADWKRAEHHLRRLRSHVQDLAFSDDSNNIRPWTLYLQGVLAQSAGDFTTALTMFQSPELLLPENKSAKANDVRLDLQILATFNSLLIVYPSSHPQHSMYSRLLAAAEPFCKDHVNPAIVAGLSLLRALQLRDALLHVSDQSHEAIITMNRQNLFKAIEESRKCKNSQLLTLSLAFMRQMIFDRSTTEKAVQSGRSAWAIARKHYGSELWTAVADGMLECTFERLGNLQEAAKYRQDGEMLLLHEPFGQGSGVPQALRDVCMRDAT